MVWIYKAYGMKHISSSMFTYDPKHFIWKQQQYYLLELNTEEHVLSCTNRYKLFKFCLA